MKKAYIIPGFGEYATDDQYQKLNTIFSSAGYTPEFIALDWSMSIDTWIREAEKMMQEPNAIVCGFSFGAYIGVLLCDKLRAQHLFACSLSPYFSDDIEQLPHDALNYFGKDHIAQFAAHTFPKESQTPTTFFFGDRDWDYAIKKTRDRSAEWHGPSTFILVPEAEHSLANTTYLNLLEKEIEKLPNYTD